MVKQKHTVDFFDSMTMKNRTEKCVVLSMSLSDNEDVEDMATCQIERPIRKRIRVPITCLVCLHTGQRLPFPVE
jgi:hypothetical protein